MSLLSQSCAEATRLLSESQDKPLPLAARVGLRLHLAICGGCRRYRKQLEQMRIVFNALPDQLTVEPLPEEFRRELIRKLESQNG